MYDLEERKFLDNRDVIFCEKVFPFAGQPLPQSQDDYSAPKLGTMWLDDEEQRGSPPDRDAAQQDTPTRSAGGTADPQ